jgi:predicted amidohydrolase YtcJ
MDSHCHPVALGNDLKYGVELTMAMSAKEIIDEVAAFIKKNDISAGQWVTGRRWDEYKYPKMVTRWDLDEVTKEGQLVELIRVYRGLIYNTAALKRILGVDDEEPGTWPKWWTEDPTIEKIKASPQDYPGVKEWDGVTEKIFREERFIKTLNKKVQVPTGVFVGRNSPLLVTGHPNYKKMGPQPLPLEERYLGIKRLSEAMLALGVTAMRPASTDLGEDKYHDTRIYQEAKTRGYLKIRLMELLHGIYFSPNVHGEQYIRNDLTKMAIVRNMDDRYLRGRGTKYYSDGGVGTRTAWLSEPFINSEKFGEKEPNYGVPMTNDYEARRKTYMASLERGLDLFTHICGDQAFRFTVDLYADLMKAIKRGEVPVWKGRLEAMGGHWDFRWGAEHAYLPLEPKTNVMDDLYKYNIIAHVQPVFGWQLGASFVENLGPERIARWTPMRSYFERGVICPNGSDYGVASHNPWYSIYFMLTREIQAQNPQSFGSGKDSYRDETVGISEALISACAMGPYSTFAESWKGSIKPGHVADLVVLDLKNIFDLEKNPKTLLEMDKKILVTLVDGEVRYLKPGFKF